jgi:predicted DsbA family dithiol-disulfide isomerase
VYFPLHPDTPPEGRSLADMFGERALAASMVRLKKLMDEEGLPFAEERSMTFNSRLAQELAKWGEGFDRSEQLNTALYQAYFVDGRNLHQQEVLLGIVDEVGLPVAEAREVLEGRSMSQAVDDDWQHALSIGVRSVPTFAVGLTGVVGAQPYEVLANLVEHSGARKRS